MSSMTDDFYRAKYVTLVNAILNVARVSTHTGSLYTVDDEYIYKVVEAMEPERVEKIKRDFKEYGL